MMKTTNMYTGQNNETQILPILATHDRGAMTKMAEDILHGALAQSDSHAKGQPGRVHLLVALAVQELAPS